MEGVTSFIESNLKLRVNREKSSVTRPYKTQFLGFSFTRPYDGKVKSKISNKSLRRFKDRVRELTKSRKRVRFEIFIRELRSYLNGWKGYFGRANCTSIFRELDTWIRRRVRCFIWQQWRRIRTRFRRLKQFGISDDLAMTTAATRKGAWRLSNSPALCMAFTIRYFDKIGLPRLFIKL